MAEEIKKVEKASEEKVEAKANNEKATNDKKEVKGNGEKPHFHGKGKKDAHRVKKDEPKEFDERIVDINRISKTVQGGRHMRFSALAVIGDHKGRYGFAMEKSGEVPDAIKKSLEAARHNLHNLHIVKGATIAHEVMGKYGATKVYLKPAPAGTGIIAGGPVRAILELAGLKNVVSKVYGARASINVIRATNNAISQLKSYRQIQTLRGKGE